MQVESNSNYNTLGRMGPLYPRPEYRPRPAGQDLNPERGGDPGTDRVRVSPDAARNRAKAAAAAERTPAVVPEGRLNLQSARTLTAAACEAITRLSPSSVAGGPHRTDGLGLMAPRYV